MSDILSILYSRSLWSRPRPLKPDGNHEADLAEFIAYFQPFEFRSNEAGIPGSYKRL